MGEAPEHGHMQQQRSIGCKLPSDILTCAASKLSWGRATEACILRSTLPSGKASRLVSLFTGSGPWGFSATQSEWVETGGQRASCAEHQIEDFDVFCVSLNQDTVRMKGVCGSLVSFHGRNLGVGERSLFALLQMLILRQLLLWGGQMDK